jgi:hypothetical protein
MSTISIKHPKRLIVISVCAVVALCGIALALLTAGTDDNIVHIQQPAVQPSWTSDPANIQSVENGSDVIAQVRYTGKKYSYKTTDNAFIYTAYTVDILDVLKGDITEKRIEISAAGGIVSLKEWNDNSPLDEKYVSEEIEQMSDKELKASTMDYDAGYGVDFEKGDIAVVFLSEVNGKYYVRFGGLSLFEQKANGDYANPELSPVVVDTATINVKVNNLNPATEGA